MYRTHGAETFSKMENRKRCRQQPGIHSMSKINGFAIGGVQVPHESAWQGAIQSAREVLRLRGAFFGLLFEGK